MLKVCASREAARSVRAASARSVSGGRPPLDTAVGSAQKTRGTLFPAPRCKATYKLLLSLDAANNVLAYPGPLTDNLPRVRLPRVPGLQAFPPTTPITMSRGVFIGTDSGQWPCVPIDRVQSACVNVCVRQRTPVVHLFGPWILYCQPCDTRPPRALWPLPVQAQRRRSRAACGKTARRSRRSCDSPTPTPRPGRRRL